MRRHYTRGNEINSRKLWFLSNKMALFHMQRFLGEEGRHSAVDKSSENILKKLHEKAKARERQIQHVQDQLGHSKQEQQKVALSSKEKPFKTKLKKTSSEEPITSVKKQNTVGTSKKKKSDKEKRLPPEIILKRLHAKAKARERASLDQSKHAAHGSTVLTDTGLTQSTRNAKSQQEVCKKQSQNQDDTATSSSEFPTQDEKNEACSSTSSETRRKKKTQKEKIGKMQNSQNTGAEDGSNSLEKTEVADTAHKPVRVLSSDLDQVKMQRIDGADSLQAASRAEANLLRRNFDGCSGGSVKKTSMREFRELAKSKKKKSQNSQKTTDTELEAQQDKGDMTEEKTHEPKTVKRIFVPEEMESTPSKSRFSLKKSQDVAPSRRTIKRKSSKGSSDEEDQVKKYLKLSPKRHKNNLVKKRHEDLGKSLKSSSGDEGAKDAGSEVDDKDQDVLEEIEDEELNSQSALLSGRTNLEKLRLHQKVMASSGSQENSFVKNGDDIGKSGQRENDESSSEKPEVAEDSESKEDSDEMEMDFRPASKNDTSDGLGDDTVSNDEKADAGEDATRGFAPLGGEKSKKKQKVTRVLPDWLAQPTLIEHDLKKHSIAVQEMNQLDPRLERNLTEEGITQLFPVQRHVIPVILDSVSLGLHAGDAGYRPRDLCVSAPTGSGKTLAFALPIVQALLDRVVPRIRALVVLPTRDLAQQVNKVFTSLCRGTDLRPALIGGLKKFAQEQRMLGQTSNGDTQCDIVVATPGRLVDHINKTQGFTLQYLRFLVIDEADRMMEQISQDWIAQVEKCTFSEVGGRSAPGAITVANCAKINMPLQKLLFSATLSQNPEKLIQLNLFQPRLITSVVSTKKSGQLEDKQIEERGEFVGKYTTPVGLTEYYIQCTPGEKPLVVLHLVKTLCLRQILCFANTVEATHRLYHLIRLVGGVEVAEFSSNQTAGQRRQILKQFKAGKIQLLICSDAMARGMDVENAKYVISYDMPPYLKTYIHRVGRTARAGKTGQAFSLLQQHEVPKLLKMLKHAGKTNLQKHQTNLRDMDDLVESYEKALQKLPGTLKMEKSHSS